MDRTASSREAHELIKPHKETHYKIIKDALKEIGVNATSKRISEQCTLSYHEVARRLSEMELKGMVKVVGRAFNVPKRPLLWDLTERELVKA